MAPRILIAASGTGGHLFPAVYIAQALAKEGAVDVAFVGSGRPLEASIFAKAGDYPVHVISAVGVKNRGVKGFLQFLFTLPTAFYESWCLLSTFKPQCVVGVGGYVTVLPVILAKLRGIRTWVHEAELAPGLANYILSFFADTVSTAFVETTMPTKRNVIATGHPVREGLERCAATSARAVPAQNILVIGGSQGAAALDAALPAIGSLFQKHHLRIRHQCRQDAVDVVRKAYASKGVEASVVPFIDDMHEAFQWADIIISRSGAGSVMELGIVNKPSILVPFPFSQGNHQLANARTLADHGKAVICEEGDSFPERLAHALESLLLLDQYNQMLLAKNPNRNSDGAHRIAKGILARVM